MKSISRTSYTVILCLLLCGIVGTSYMLGYQKGGAGAQNTGVVIDYKSIPKEFIVSADQVAQKPTITTKGVFFGSGGGTKYYGSTACANAKRIKPENYVWFATKEEAEIQGYTRGQC
jgi:hypothetical protein